MSSIDRYPLPFLLQIPLNVRLIDAGYEFTLDIRLVKQVLGNPFTDNRVPSSPSESSYGWSQNGRRSSDSFCSSKSATFSTWNALSDVVSSCHCVSRERGEERDASRQGRPEMSIASHGSVSVPRKRQRTRRGIEQRGSEIEWG